MYGKWLKTALFFLFLSSAAMAEEAAPGRSLNLQETDLIVNEALDSFNIPGMAIGIVADGKVLLSKGYGWRDLERGLPVTEKTLFAIGSCSKAFTALLLGQLVDEGKISWDDPVIAHIPELRLMDCYTTHHVTIRDLIAHRTGVARHDLLWFNTDFCRSDLIRVLEHLESACGLRETFHYNNLMYALAGAVIERVTGQSWEEVLSSRIFIPLGMVDSTSSVEESQKSSDFSLPYAEHRALAFRNLHAVAPAGAVNSSASEMVKWIQFQLSDGAPLHLRKETLQEMHTIQMPLALPPTSEGPYSFGYGLGWFTGIYEGRYFVHHGGAIDGFISHVALFPQENIGIVVLSNNSNDAEFLVPFMTNTLIDRLLEKNDVDWIGKAKTLRKQVKELEQADDNEESSSPPSHKLEEYVGHYEHPSYGTIRVHLEGEQLTAHYGTMVIPLSHKCYDIFNGKMNEPLSANAHKIVCSFSCNSLGDICALSIPFEGTVQPIVFKRKAESHLFSHDYLKQFVGSYGEAPLVIEVLMRGEKLFLSGAMGQENELLPESLGKFNLKGVPGYQIHFTMDSNGKVSQMTLVHPLGSIKFMKI